MNINLLSMDNPYVTKIGGKHIHLSLLERGLKEINNCKVSTNYYNMFNRNIFDKLKTRAILYTKGYLSSYISDTKYKKNYMEKLTRNTNTDIVNAHDSLSLISFKGKAKGKILTLHGYLSREVINYGNFSDREKSIVEDYFMDVERKALNIADHVITVDTRIKNYLIDEFNYPSDKIKVIYNAIDTDKFHPVSNIEKNTLRSELNLKKDDIIVLIPRRLVKKNGILNAAKAALQCQNDNFKFIFIGDGPLKNDLIDYSNKTPNIIFLGKINHDEIVKYYQCCDIVLIPSILSDGVEEATSLSMLEGMSAGKVVLCSEIGGMKEVIKNEKNGIFIKQNSPSDIIEKIVSLIKNPEIKENIQINATEYAKENHGYMNHARNFYNEYVKCI